MTNGVPVGRIFGVPVTVNWSVIVVALFVTYTLAFQILPIQIDDASRTSRLVVGGLSAVLFFVSILVHEVGHALLARRHDVEVEGITLWFLGGVAKLLRQAPTPKAEFQIAIAGPAASIGLGLAFGVCARIVGATTGLDLLPVVLWWLAAVNLLLGVTNLLPAAPLDGGRVLAAALWKRIGAPEPARLIAARTGLVAGAALALGAFVAIVFFDRLDALWLSTAVMGLFLLSAAKGEVLGAAIRQRLQNASIDSLVVRHPPTVSDSWTADQLLGWSYPSGVGVAFPVTRWGHEPLGAVVPAWALGLDVPTRSWTTVEQMMVPAAELDRAWTSDTVADVFERIGVVDRQAIVVHDPATGQVVGTVTSHQIDHLFARPDFWGRDRQPKSRPVRYSPTGDQQPA